MINRRYLLLSLATAIGITAASFAAPGLAQSTLSCSTPTPVVSPNQTAVFTAFGGTGSYTWSGQNLSVTNPTGSQFSVSYPATGSYTISVASGGQVATCGLTVSAGGSSSSSGGLSCTPAVQNVTLGQTAFVSAAGGTGSYTWSAPGLLVTNPTGSGFSASYASAGTKAITVTSGSASASCIVNVLAGGSSGASPGMPNTGGGYGQP